MRILVTGAGGFLGRSVVDKALVRGHEVVAFVRSMHGGIPFPWEGVSGLDIVEGDLRNPAALDGILSGIDVVVHLAAAKTGDLHLQMANTVVGTENLLRAMDRADVRSLVLLSSFTVYDYRAIPKGGIVDESSPTEARPEQRDAYTETKLLQEELAIAAASAGRCGVTILRPGVVYGPNEYWSGRLGQRLSPAVWIRLGGRAYIPLTYVENCADVVILAAEQINVGYRIYNVLDQTPPTQKQYVDRLREFVRPKPIVVTVPWSAALFAAQGIRLFNRLVLSDRLRVPGVLRVPSLHARGKPLRYTGARVRRELGWQPAVPLDQGMLRTFHPEAGHVSPSGSQP